MSSFVPSDVSIRPSSSRSIFQYIPYQRVGHFTALVDFALVLGSALLSGIAYHVIFFDSYGDPVEFAAVGGCSGFLFVVISKLLGLYQPNALLSSSTQVRGILISWTTVLLFLTAVFFVLKSGANFSRGATIGFGAIGFLYVLGSRSLIGANLKKALSEGTIAGPRIVVIGEPQELIANTALSLLRTYGVREVGRFQVSSTNGPNGPFVSDDMKVINAAINSARKNRAEQVMLAFSWDDASRRDLICERLRILPLPILLLPDESVKSVLSQTDKTRGTLAPVEIQRGPLSRQDLFIKRAFDVLVSGFGLVALSPLLLITAIIIKLSSPGPIIFRQRRRGFSGSEFTIYKFRTMCVLEDGPRVQQAKRNDERVTKIGRLLRISSIDELPQLVNVLVGNMSLVGPRPHAIAHDEEYSLSVENYAFRHHMKPGITGWAQTNGFRGETVQLAAMKKRIQLDLWYINNWSFWLDLKIVVRTCFELLRARNAY